jgi:hypothetical protein
MKELFTKRVMPVLALLAVLAWAAPGAAQVFTGRIDLTVADSTGALLPGATVDLTGPRNESKPTDAQGTAHFLDLPPGTYEVKVSLSGFSDYLNREVPVTVGGAVPLRITLAIAGVQTQVQVTAETPVIDNKKTGTSTNVTLEELQNVPSGRDPWVVMQTVPGIIMDRVNVGGSESGQQSGYQAKGASGADATWNLEGVPITDMAATGATPTYYDFDMFQELNVTTGGSDLTSSTGGVHLNMVLKSGSNTPHGSTRIYFEDESMQSNNMDESLANALGSPNGKGNRMKQYKDYGFELGGPLVKDRLWAWGSIGKTDVKTLTIKQTPDNTFLKNYAFKATGQLNQNIRANFTYYKGDKQKFGRSAGPLRPPETTYDQGSTGPGFFKGEGNFVVRSNLFLTGRVSHYPWGFFLTPEGGLDKQVYFDDGGVAHGSYLDYRSDRPSDTIAAEGSYFLGKHELKFGYSWRKTQVHSSTTWAGNKVLTFFNGYPDMIAEADPVNLINAEAKYVDAYVSDNITAGRLTANLGVRFDHQTDSLQQYSMPGITLGGFATWLPDLTSPAQKNVIVWNSASPRLSVSYGLDENRKTLLRGSYAMFASQLGNGASTILAVGQYRYVGFDAVDLNGNHIADLNEIDFNSAHYSNGCCSYANGIDITNPSSLDTPNRVGDYTVPKTHEFIVGVDHELMPNFGLSAAFTYRRMVDFNWQPNIGVRSGQYVQVGVTDPTHPASPNGGPLPDGSNYSVPYFAVPLSAIPAEGLSQGNEYVTRKGYHQRFLGFEASATKRLSNHWMARFGFSTNKHQEFFDDRATAIQDPTPGPTGPLVDGGLVITQSGGSGKSSIYQLLPLYQLIATGMYQARWGIDLGFNYNMRQGFGQPWFRSRVSTPADYFASRKSVLVTDVSDHRLSTVQTFDVRVGKGFRFQRASLNLDLDVFNLFNQNTVLGRQFDLRLTGPTGFNQVLEIMNPRIARVGVRFNF